MNKRAPIRPLPHDDPFAPRSDALPHMGRSDLRRSSGVGSLSELARLFPGMAEVREQARAWWPDSHAEILDAAATLTACASPLDLEEATCDLLGRRWHRWHEEHGLGLMPQEWLAGLLDAAAPRATEPAVRRLLYGLAVITTPGPAGAALGLLADHRGADDEPAWLAVPPTVTASPDVTLLRDVYGLRYGLVAQVTGPSGLPRSYLYDVDLCHGFTQVLTSGYHPDLAAATAAWRDLVGVSAADAEPVPAPADLLPVVLPLDGVLDAFFGSPLTDSQFHELHRGDRIVLAVADALAAAGRPVTDDRSDPQQAADLAQTLADRFRAWADTGTELPPTTGPDDDVVAWLLADWVSPGMSEQLCLACSPHRIAAFTAYLNDDWQPRERGLALALLEPLARFCLEHSGVTGPAAEHTLAWARRAVSDPDAVGGDLGNQLNLPLDETTVTTRPSPSPSPPTSPADSDRRHDGAGSRSRPVTS